MQNMSNKMAQKLNVLLLILLAVMKLNNAHAITTGIHSRDSYENINTLKSTENNLIKITSNNMLDDKDFLNKILRSNPIQRQDAEENFNLNMWVDFFKVHRGITFKNVNYMIPNTEQSFSVVQDWNSVCSQLCGSGLGGAGCHHGPHPDLCDKIKEENSKNEDITLKAKKLLKNNDSIICRDLCKYQLGGDVCGCQNKAIKTSPSNPDQNDQMSTDRNQICGTFCEHNSITLAGCSVCSKKTTIKSTITTTTTPKPNWDEICIELCKTGDGGALCNCDKPPFF